MTRRAPRRAVRMLRRLVRGARLAVCVVLAGLGVVPVMADTIASASFVMPTDRYAHGILGDAIEWAGLDVALSTGDIRRFALPDDHVFEDVAPRIVDLDGDGLPEIIVVETDMARGAALAVYGPQGKITETPHIGMRNRWLAPIGAADLDGDGAVEIAFVDRPHLAKTLRIWRYEAGALTHVASLEGFTNHRIGEVDIAGGIRTCAGVAEMIVATGNWSELVAIRWNGTQFRRTTLGTDTTRPAFARALRCAD